MNNGEQKIELKVSGMSCAACSTRIDKKLNKTDGVLSANVNLATERASVDYDSRITSYNVCYTKLLRIINRSSFSS